MRRAARIIATAVIALAAVLILLVVLLPAALGLERYVITGGSMTGTIDRGSVVYSRLTPVDRLEVGDIVTFVPPGFSSPVTHRIVDVTRGSNGKRVFRTRGDFNSVADPWTISFPQSTEPRAVFHIPYVGYVLAALTLRPLGIVLIGLPALVIAASLLWSLWRGAGEDVRRLHAAGADVRRLHAAGAAADGMPTGPEAE
jgi:signal peptidase I